MKLTQWIAAVGLSLAALTVNAAQYTLDGFFPSSMDNHLFPGLRLEGVDKVTLEASDTLHSPYLQIDSLTIQFKHAAPLVARNFKRTDDQRYLALVEDVWVFNRLLVEVSGGLLNDEDPLHVRVMVVDVSSQLNDLDDIFGPDLVRVDATLRDVSPRILADSQSLVLDNKPLTLQLMDRLGSHDHTGMTPPTPGYEKGFHVVSNWQGKGVKTFYLPTPFSADQFREYRAVALQLETYEAPHGTDYFARISYQDRTGMKHETPPVFLNDILQQAYSHP